MHEKSYVRKGASERTPGRLYRDCTECSHYELDRGAWTPTELDYVVACRHLRGPVCDDEGAPMWADGTRLREFEFALLEAGARHVLNYADQVLAGFCCFDGEEELCVCPAISASEVIDG